MEEISRLTKCQNCMNHSDCQSPSKGNLTCDYYMEEVLADYENPTKSKEIG